MLALLEACSALNWWLLGGGKHRKRENELKANKLNGVEQITKSKECRWSCDIRPLVRDHHSPLSHLWCDKSIGIVPMAAMTIDSDSHLRSASFAISKINENRASPACSPADVFPKWRKKCRNIMRMEQPIAEDKRNYFSILNDNRFPIHWFRTSVTAGNTYKFTSESRSSSKSLGRKSKQFFEMSNEISNWRPRKVSLWSVDRRLTDKSLWVVSGSHVVERKYKKKR